jgi:vanillate O-demethylase ferredoxin subunit
VKLRPAFLRVHRWAGLTIGLVVMVSAFTGAGMAFRNQLDPHVYPQLFKATTPCANPLPFSGLVRSAKAANPKGKLVYIRIFPAGEAPSAVRFTHTDTVYVDRCTGLVTGAQNRYAGIFGSLEFIHKGQWAPPGGTIMGVGALSVVLILGAGGVFLWWPRNLRHFGRGFVMNRRLKGPAFTLVLHRTTGAWVVTFLMLSALTGIPNAFPGVITAMMRIGAPPSVAPLKSIPPEGARPKPLALDKVWKIVTRLSPEPREVLIPLTRRAPTDPLELFIIAADAPHANARTYVDLDAYSGKVLKFTPYREASIGAKIYYYGLSLHTGKLGGIVGELCLFIGALGALTLGVTGIQAFGSRLLRRNAKLATAGRAVPASAQTPSSTTAS